MAVVEHVELRTALRETARTGGPVAAFERLFERITLHTSDDFEIAITTFVNRANKNRKQADLINKAYQYFTQMKSDGVTPTLPTYNILLKGLCQYNQDDQITAVAAEMREQKNQTTYATLISYYTKKENLREIERWTLLMRTHRIQLTSEIYTAVLQVCMRLEDKTKTERYFNDAKADKISLPENIKCEVETFLEDNPSEHIAILNNSLKKRCETDVYDKVIDLLRKNPAVHRSTFKVVIETCCLRGKLEMAEQFFVMMQDKKMTASVSIYNALLRAFVDANQPEKVKEYVAHMEKCSVVANSVTEEIIQKIADCL